MKKTNKEILAAFAEELKINLDRGVEPHTALTYTMAFMSGYCKHVTGNTAVIFPILWETYLEITKAAKDKKKVPT